MSLRIETSNPSQLLKKIKDAIDKHHVETWSYDKDGDFTHSPTQWNNKAWLHPTEKMGVLEFTIIRPQNVTVLDATTNGVYHGRFIEMLMTHFRPDFTKASAIP